MSQTTPIVEFRQVSKIFKDFWMRPKVKAVQDVNLTINQGEIFGLLGPNGAGKSTTIKMLLGLLFPTKGQISIMGKHPRDNAVKQFVGYMPEDSYLYPYLNAEEVLSFYGKIFGYSGDTARKRIDVLLDMVGLRGASHRPIHEYSKGMARRIALAQALINDPNFLILDEPTTGMDPIGNREFKDLIYELKSKGKTILICSHLLSDMQDLCDRVAIFYGGKVVSQGEVSSLLAPGENLEEYFLNTVTKAQEGQTGGAVRGKLDKSFFSQKEKINSESEGMPLSASAATATLDNEDQVDAAVEPEKQEPKPNQSFLDQLTDDK